MQRWGFPPRVASLLVHENPPGEKINDQRVFGFAQFLEEQGMGGQVIDKLTQPMTFLLMLEVLRAR